MQPDTAGKKPMSVSGPKRIFDVMRPGKAPASATSRPVIVGHKPTVQDDMVGGTSSSYVEHNQTPRPLLDARTKVTVQPTGTLNRHNDDEVAVTSEKVTPLLLPAETEITPVEKTPRLDETEVAPADITDQAPMQKHQEAIPQHRGNDLDEAMKEMPPFDEPGRVIVSAHTPKGHWVRNLFLVIGFVLLIAVGLNLVLDTGIVKTIPHGLF